MRYLFAALMIGGMALSVAGCANRTGNATLEAYCSQPNKQNEDICKAHFENQETRMTLGQRIDSVFGIANDARSRADRAQATADATKLTCVTRTLRNTQVGQCDAGYSVAGCTQTRFTKRAGGQSILREVSDQRCRFNDRVLEMQVRCCYVGPNPPPTTAPASTTPPPAFKPTTPQPRPIS